MVIWEILAEDSSLGRDSDSAYGCGSIFQIVTIQEMHANKYKNTFY